MKVFKGFLVVSTLLSSLAVASVSPNHGLFALQGGSARADAYLTATPIGANPLDLHLDLWMTQPGSTTPLRAYDVDMTKFLHMIVVSDDFRTFLHVHPVLQSDGHFLLNLDLPEAAVYHVYADATPHGIGQQVFRFDLDLGGGRVRQRDLSERGTVAATGPYTVTLSTNTIRSNGEAMILVHIRKNGKPAADLHPYLGALGHAVFLDAQDLSYVHVHPMPLGAKMTMDWMNMSEMKPLPDSMTTSPDMMLHVELRQPGTYKLWLQFRGGTRLYVAPFVITAS